MELLTMAVLLKNLTARTPHADDLAALNELVRLCENDRDSMAGSTLEELLATWQQPDFHLANDAWVIVTTRGQIVGLACVWHEEHARISTFICVHPDYRERGIGTLLLRMAEMRARQHAHLARPGQRVVLQGLITGANEGAQRLFEREGYRPGSPFLRVTFTLSAEDEARDRPATRQRCQLDISQQSQARTLATSPLSERDALCRVSRYQTYEKELRPAGLRGADVEETFQSPQADRDAVATSASFFRQG